MLKQLEKHLEKNFAFLKNKKLLLTVSGGIDSVVLTHLFCLLGYEVEVAHCNFKLRKEESNLDESFVKEFAFKLNIPFRSINFNTEEYCKKNKVSTQIGARELRYCWFDELAKQHGFEYILTAHHLNDVMETFFINLSRGTGIDGLTSIPAINNNIIRPLLIFSREEIETYALTNQITWREDKSNAETKYLRNKIRHTIVPKFYALNTQFEENFKTTISNLHQSEAFIKQKIEILKKNIFSKQNEQLFIKKTDIECLSNFEIYELFKPYGFSTAKEVLKLLKAQTGKELFSKNHTLLNNREHFILYTTTDHLEESYTIQHAKDINNLPINIIFSTAEHQTSKDVILIDLDKNSFPLTLRKRKNGDVFSPIGMTGSKKVSKYLKDLKLSKIEKDQVWILCNKSNKIIWIVGLRADKTNTTKTPKKNTIYIVKQ